jgi:hypothetical protein
LPSESERDRTLPWESWVGPDLALAIVLLPVVSVVLAAVPVGAGRFGVDAIDEANAYNDLARTPRTPCAAAPR